MISPIVSIFCRIAHLWSYANTIETAVLLVIVFDVIWHYVNAIRDVKRDELSEARSIQREEALEKRQIRREHREIIRKHWQELQSNLISLQRITGLLTQQKRFVRENSDSQDPTTRHLLLMMVNRLPESLAEFHDLWGRVVAQLNVFPGPRDLLALEVLALIEKLGETMKDNQAEVKDETLLALADLAKRVADKGKLSNLDD